MKKYHVHLTLDRSDIEPPKGWKKTLILLKNGHVQKDVMLTRHFVFGKGGVKSMEDIHNQIQSLALTELKRVKVEQEEGFE